MPTYTSARQIAISVDGTGGHFERKDVRGKGGCCGSLTELIRKARDAGEGAFYMPLNLWPADSERLDLRKSWVVMS